MSATVRPISHRNLNSGQNKPSSSIACHHQHHHHHHHQQHQHHHHHHHQHHYHYHHYPFALFCFVWHLLCFVLFCEIIGRLKERASGSDCPGDFIDLANRVEEFTLRFLDPLKHDSLESVMILKSSEKDFILEKATKFELKKVSFETLLVINGIIPVLNPFIFFLRRLFHKIVLQIRFE